MKGRHGGGKYVSTQRGAQEQPGFVPAKWQPFRTLAIKHKPLRPPLKAHEFDPAFASSKPETIN